MWKFILVTFFFTFQLSAQELYNSCDRALELCPNQTFSVNNRDANRTLCGGCEDDFTNCFSPISSIWLKFTTNDIGGALQISFFDAEWVDQTGRDKIYNAGLYQANVPCNAVSYAQVGNGVQNATNLGLISADNLPANTTYYVCVSGGMGNGFNLPGEFEMNLTISGAAVQRDIPWVFASLNPIVCPGQPLYALVGTGNCPDQGEYRWYMNGELVQTGMDTIFYSLNYTPGGILTVETTCYTQCAEIVSFSSDTIRVNPIVVDAGPDKVIMSGESIMLSSTIPSNCVITWTPSYGLSHTDNPFPIADPSQTTLYTLSVLDTNSGCTAYDYVTVKVLSGLVIPNTFSPNGDGQNDTWYVEGLEAYPDNEIKIFTRWGQVIFEARNFNALKAWDGTIKSGAVQESVFYYVLKLNDEEETEFNGSITLLR